MGMAYLHGGPCVSIMVALRIDLLLECTTRPGAASGRIGERRVQTVGVRGGGMRWRFGNAEMSVTIPRLASG